MEWNFGNKTQAHDFNSDTNKKTVSVSPDLADQRIAGRHLPRTNLRDDPLPQVAGSHRLGLPGAPGKIDTATGLASAVTIKPAPFQQRLELSAKGSSEANPIRQFIQGAATASSKPGNW